MKKIIVLFFFFCIKMNAQEVNFGVKFGLNIAQTNNNKQSQRYAMHYGVMAEIREKGSLFAFQPELFYSGQGYATRYRTTKNIHIFDYIAMPIVVKYYLTNQLNLQLAPRPSINVKIARKIENNTNSFEQEEVGVRSFDFGISAGVGYKHHSGLNASIRYYLGAREIYKYAYQTMTRNSVFQFSVGYFF